MYPWIGSPLDGEEFHVYYTPSLILSEYFFSSIPNNCFICLSTPLFSLFCPPLPRVQVTLPEKPLFHPISVQLQFRDQISIFNFTHSISISIKQYCIHYIDTVWRTVSAQFWLNCVLRTWAHIQQPTWLQCTMHTRYKNCQCGRDSEQDLPIDLCDKQHDNNNRTKLPQHTRFIRNNLCFSLALSNCAPVIWRR